MLCRVAATSERVIAFYEDSFFCCPVLQSLVLIFEMIFVLNYSRRNFKIVDEMRD